MRLTIDCARRVVEVESDGMARSLPFDSQEAFAAVSDAWLQVGWDAKHVYTFTWLGRPIIQLPEDMFRVQEVVSSLQPDVIVETGVAHGGSLIFYASLAKALGRGRVIGVDIDIRPHNRAAIESHPLFDFITLIEGSSTAPAVVDQVGRLISPDDTVMVMLDSGHSKDHVLGELEAYSPFVTVGSYIVAADGIMQDLVGAPRSNDDWAWNNPRSAAAEFLSRHGDFTMATPEFLFNESVLQRPVTYWPEGWLRRTW